MVREIGPKLDTEAQVHRLLRGLGLRLDESKIRKVVYAFQKGSPTKYSLWSKLRKRNGSASTYVCDKETVNKIERLYRSGALEPYLYYLDGLGNIATVDEATENIQQAVPQQTYRQRKPLFVDVDSYQLRRLSDFGLPGNGAILIPAVTLQSVGGAVYIKELRLDPVNTGEPVESVHVDADAVYGTQRNAPDILDGKCDIHPLFLIPEPLNGSLRLRVLVEESNGRVNRSNRFVMPNFEDGATVRVNEEGQDASSEYRGHEGVVVKAVNGHRDALDPDQWQAAYEICFEELGRTDVIAGSQLRSTEEFA